MLIGSAPCCLHLKHDCFIDQSERSPFPFTILPHWSCVSFHPSSLILFSSFLSPLPLPLISYFILPHSRLPPFPPTLYFPFVSLPSFFPPSPTVSPPTTAACFQSPLNLLRLITVREKYPPKGPTWHSLVAVLMRSVILTWL